ncbi:hypothetical protein GCM10025865_10620 [Paraoerskovia sediminicola]|uniref:ABC transmembrane type-1 domain-containing protein n=1 Tax=Paraoerskovia sediminicola TaxID=1138587 RepID=A0ABM8G115_9CELL|nr:hypothetical protein [Paraoerskovia sediminicola]BDZ41763.1 hypothetical protein GCM10025865_10620 [Paraoerskovia sediminicola]
MAVEEAGERASAAEARGARGARRPRDEYVFVGTPAGGRIRPETFLRPGALDPAALLVARIVRRSFYPALFVGLTIAWVTGTFTAETFDLLNSPGEYIAALLSPLVGIAIAIALRFLGIVLGFVLAFPLASSAWATGTAATSRLRRTFDRINVTSAYAAIRWTWAVQQEAAARAGSVGRQLVRVELVLRVLTPVSVVAFLVVATVTVSG